MPLTLSAERGEDLGDDGGANTALSGLANPQPGQWMMLLHSKQFGQHHCGVIESVVSVGSGNFDRLSPAPPSASPAPSAGGAGGGGGGGGGADATTVAADATTAAAAATPAASPATAEGAGNGGATAVAAADDTRMRASLVKN